MAKKARIKKLKEEPKKQILSILSEPESIKPEPEVEAPPKPGMRQAKKGGRWVWV